MMSQGPQRTRRGGGVVAPAGGTCSPTPPGAGGPSRPQPLRATVPFQLKHGSPTRGTAHPSSTTPAASSSSSASSPAASAPSPAQPQQPPPPSPALSPAASVAAAAAASSPTPPSGSVSLAWGAAEHGRLRPRRSPEHRDSPERRSPSSPVCKVEKNKFQHAPSHIRRTSSLDTITGPYLTGQWPRELPGRGSPCMRDKSTQTPSSWTKDSSEKKKGSHKRSASWGTSDQLKEIAKLRQHLQRSKKSSKHQRDKERHSPLHGNHAAIHPAQVSISRAIPIPVTSIAYARTSLPRMKNSVEGVNQEIERMFISEDRDKDGVLRLCESEDGRRAPVPSQQRSVDTQTPSGPQCSRESSSSSSSGTSSTSSSSSSESRSHSVSPNVSVAAAAAADNNNYSPCCTDELLAQCKEKENGDSSPLPKYATSPKPNNSYMFKREPPEGCEKVKVFEEILPKQLGEIPTFYGPDKNKVNFIPKRSSAFCPVSIMKPLLFTPELAIKGFPGLGPMPITGGSATMVVVAHAASQAMLTTAQLLEEGGFSSTNSNLNANGLNSRVVSPASQTTTMPQQQQQCGSSLAVPGTTLV
ncbi:glucocorticoid-induced transcript 1 protein-like isoform X1 [Lampetra fluviatilis]